jgi:hypothetical protein
MVEKVLSTGLVVRRNGRQSDNKVRSYDADWQLEKSAAQTHETGGIVTG